MQKTANDIARRLFAAFLSLVLVVVLLPAAAVSAADLPDWYFLFVIFKNVDADCQNANDEVTHIKYTMTRKEIDLAGEYAEWFEKFMNGVGVMRAHVDVLTIDATVTELAESDYGAYLNSDQAAPLLKGKVDLDRYDHVIGIVNFTMRTGAGGMTDLPFENGTGFSSINFFHSSNTSYSQGSFVHEFLHFMEDRSGAWGGTFDLHGIIEKYYNKQYSDINGLTDIMLNRVKRNAETGTGVTPVAWQYPPRVLRAIRELVIPSGVTSIGYSAFYRYGNLESVIISNGVTSIGDYAFNRCSGLKSVTIPASVTSIGYATFGNTKVKDVYYGGTEAQWKAVHIGEYNSGLTNAAIHYNSPMPTPKPTATPRPTATPTPTPTPTATPPANTSGNCGTNVTWSYSNGTLTIQGRGKMDNYDYDKEEKDDEEALPPWYDRREQIRTVKISDGVTGIGSYAFSDCGNLKSAAIPDSVTSIASGVFWGCGSLTDAAIPASVTDIGYAAFAYCDSLTGVTIPDGVTGISDYAFYKCDSLASVTIPASVTSIGYAAFWNTDLKDVYYGGNANQWEKIRIDEYNAPLTGAALHCAVSFTDVSANAYYAAAVTWAVGNGITDGISETEFGPDSTVTRAQAVTFLYRAFGNAKSGQDGSHGLNIASIIFDDVDNDAYYVRAVYWAVTKGITNGTSDTTFSPDDPVTYAQMLTFLARAKGEMITGADWARDAVDWAQKNGATDALRFTGGDACPRRDVVYIMHRVSA